MVGTLQRLLRRGIDTREAVHVHAMMAAAPQQTKAVLQQMLAPDAEANEIKRALECIEVLGHREFTVRLWSRLMNPTHAGKQGISHHNGDFY